MNTYYIFLQTSKQYNDRWSVNLDDSSYTEAELNEPSRTLVAGGYEVSVEAESIPDAFNKGYKLITAHIGNNT